MLWHSEPQVQQVAHCERQQTTALPTCLPLPWLTYLVSSMLVLPRWLWLSTHAVIAATCTCAMLRRAAHNAVSIARLVHRHFAHLTVCILPRTQRLREVYLELVLLVRVLFQRCRLVHADLSEYNLLVHQACARCSTPVCAVDAECDA